MTLTPNDLSLCPVRDVIQTTDHANAVYITTVYKHYASRLEGYVVLSTKSIDN